MGKIKSLALTINSFDSSEFLETLISEIRDQVDYVAAIYQKKSYCGNLMDPIDMEELQRLHKLKLIDQLIEFESSPIKPHREQETDKRNFGIELMKQKGFSHILNIDSDELYQADQFREAKKEINKHNWPITYWSYINYYKDFEHYLIYPFRPFVPGIHSTYFKYTFNGTAPGPTDPTRRIYNPFNIGTYIFPDEVIRMAHGAWIRKNIRKKLENWSAKDHFTQDLIESAILRYETWKEGDNAIMLFNVPNNEVKICKLNKKIHKFVVPW